VCTGKNSAWLKTANKIYFTENNGSVWTQKNLPTAINISDIAFKPHHHPF